MLATNAVVERKLKRVVNIDNASISSYRGNMVLFGTPSNHPNTWLNGQDIHTSEVLNVNGNRVETKNTVYNVQSWEVPGTVN